MASESEEDYTEEAGSEQQEDYQGVEGPAPAAGEIAREVSPDKKKEKDKKEKSTDKKETEKKSKEKKAERSRSHRKSKKASRSRSHKKSKEKKASRSVLTGIVAQVDPDDVSQDATAPRFAQARKKKIRQLVAS